MSSNDRNPLKNFLWRFAERCGAQGVSFVVSIILARLLAPEVYGTVALVTVFTTILNVFVDSGLANALIQKKNADDLDFSTVFFFNMGVCLFLYGIMYISAPWIASFYEIPDLVPIIRVISLILVISGIKNVQQAYVSRNMMFKRFFYATLGGTLFSAIIGIAMAYYGYGVWALVAQMLLNTTIDTLVLWITVKWRPKFKFSISRLKGLFSYGWKLLVSSLLDTIYNDLRSLIIGKMYSTEDLSFYNKGKQFPILITTNVATSIDSVLLPVMASEQDDKTRVKVMARRAIMTSTYIMAPLMVGLSVIAESLIRLLLTDTWLPCVPYLRIFCVSYMFYPIHSANLNAIKAMGRSDLFLKLEIIKKAIGLLLLISTMQFGVMTMAYSMLLTTFTSQVINAWPNKKLLRYSYLEQLKDILPSILMAMVMGICVYFLYWIPFPDIMILVLQVIVGVSVYIIGSALLHLESFNYIWGILSGFVKKRKG